MNYKVEKLKLLIGFMVNFYYDLAAKLKDKKLTVIEIIQLLPWLNDLRIQLGEIPEVYESFKKMAPADRSELIEWFNQKFNLPNGKVEELIEKIFAILINLGPIISILEEPNKIQTEIEEAKEKGV